MTKHAQYKIRHETIYRYSEPVALCQNQLRMRPREQPHLKCYQWKLVIQPKPDVTHSHPDYFGNQVDSFSIESMHRSLRVIATSHVEVIVPENENLNDVPTCRQVIENVRVGKTESDWLAREFTFASPRVELHEMFAAYAREHVKPDTSIIEAVDTFTKVIHADFRYDTTATDVNTTTREAFELRAGVCQDFAHVQIAALRSLGIPSRYVSGYLRTIPPEGKPRFVGSDESHAWISVYTGPQTGWVGFDPTNAMRTTTDHIPVCVGRDYDDISPMRGVVLGGGHTSLEVRVDVEPV